MPWDQILDQLRHSQHTRLPVYEGDIDRIIGVLHMKRVVHRARARARLDREGLIDAASTRDAYFVPSGTTLNTQLLNFQRDKRRMAFVVDEYGDIPGPRSPSRTSLEEIVQEFTTDPATMMHKKTVHRSPIGRRQLRRERLDHDPRIEPFHALESAHRWTEDLERPDRRIPRDHSRTRHHAETVGLHAREVLQTGDNAIKTVRIRPPPAAPAPQAHSRRAT